MKNAAIAKKRSFEWFLIGAPILVGDSRFVCVINYSTRSCYASRPSDSDIGGAPDLRMDSVGPNDAWVYSVAGLPKITTTLFRAGCVVGHLSRACDVTPRDALRYSALSYSIRRQPVRRCDLGFFCELSEIAMLSEFPVPRLLKPSTFHLNSSNPRSSSAPATPQLFLALTIYFPFGTTYRCSY